MSKEWVSRTVAIAHQRFRKKLMLKFMEDFNKKNKFDIGDKVKVVKYGHILWESDGKGGLSYRDMRPELIGKEGLVSQVNFVQGQYFYALEKIKGKHAWYDEDQLEMVSRNPNND